MPVAVEESRNLGFWSEEEQRILGSSVVVIAGAGGDGGMMAEELTRMGVACGGGELRLADPEVFEPENTNRQFACTTATIGHNKAEAVADCLRLTRPDVKVEVLSDGVTKHNIGQLLEGAHLLIDETEFTLHGIGVALARGARAREIPNMHVMNVGFGMQITSYDKHGKYTLEDRLGVDRDAPLDDIAKAAVDVDRWLAFLPRYASMEVFESVARGQKPAPSVAPGVAIAAGFGATQAFLHLVGGGNNRPAPVYAPHVLCVDAMTCSSSLVEYPRLNFFRSYAMARLHKFLGRVPNVDY
jgi:tRNA threonylcarbamoyladenosine dehydratase